MKSRKYLCVDFCKHGASVFISELWRYAEQNDLLVIVRGNIRQSE